MAVDSRPQKLRRSGRDKKAKRTMMTRLCGLAIGLAVALGSEGIAAEAEGTWDAASKSRTCPTAARWPSSTTARTPSSLSTLRSSCRSEREEIS